MPSRRPLLAAASAVLLASAPPALADRPMGSVSTWGHELNQDELPSYRPGRLPVPPARWYRVVNRTLTDAGSNGLWFSGPSALPFPPLPLAPNEPTAWRNPRNFAAHYRRTGLRWDAAYEVWAARNALRRGATVMDPRVSPTAYTQRASLLDPAYRTASLAEIRRIVPTLRGRPYVNLYQGSDEPMVRLPHGRKALASPYARMMDRGVRRLGFPAPLATAPRRSASSREGLRWLAYNRWASSRFFALKSEQARLIRRLDPKARVLPNDYGFIRGFVPWDYSRLGAFADEVEADPYVSLAENLRPGRGRYNPGFAAKFMSDITGVRTRVIVQGFTYSGYTPTTADLYTWGAQALRAGATDLSVYASGNPRVTAPAFYRGMLALARDLRGTRLPDPPVDPAVRVLYSTMSEGQGQPDGTGDDRYLASGDALYTVYSLLGEEGHAAFTFDSDQAMQRRPQRLASTRVLWLPRADTLDRRFADAVAAWVRAGGTLIVTDPDAFTRSPDGRSLAPVRDALIGAPLGGPRAGRTLRVPEGALGPGQPADELFVPVYAGTARGFAGVPAGATVLARFLDDAPAVLSRPVGAGRVIAFSAQIMQPQLLTDPIDAVTFVKALHHSYGGVEDHPAWTFRIAGDPEPERTPWADDPRPEP